jgi:hypothetical protein
MAVKDFYTFVKDLRPFGNGTPVAFKYDATAFTGAADGEPVAGEFMAYDATNRRVVRFKADGGAGVFLGISRDSAQGIKRLGNQAALSLTEFSVFTSGVHEMVGVSGDTYVHGNAVYMNATSTQNVQKTQGVVSGGGAFSQIGTVFLPDGSTRVGAVRVPILIDNFTVGAQ